MRTPEKIRLKSGALRYQVRAPAATGGTTYRRFVTLKEAQAFAAKTETARQGGAYIAADTTWETAVEKFRAARYGSRRGLRASSIADREAGLARLSRYFAGRKLRAITPDAIDSFREVEAAVIRQRERARCDAALARAERALTHARTRNRDTTAAEARLAEAQSRAARADAAGVRSVNAAIAGLGTLLRFCQARGLVAGNAAALAGKLPHVEPEIPMAQVVLTPAEVGRLIEATDSNWRAAVALLAFAGLRVGEALALRWDDLELGANPRVFVRRTLCGVSGKFNEPKTAAGKRFVPLLPAVVRELRAWRLRCPHELMFPAGGGGPTDRHNFASRVFLPALRRARLRRVRIHDLRHSAASVWLAAGVPITTVSAWLGHGDARITLSIYAHAVPKLDAREDINRVSAFIAAQSDGCVLVGRDRASMTAHT